jgi:histidinol phosphatase-like PHP family hydrolase
MPVSRLISRAPAFKLFGELAAAEMASRARELRITAIAITDHVNRGCPWYAGFHRELTHRRGNSRTAR